MSTEMTGIRGRFERLTDRERRMVMALGGTLLLIVVFLVPFFINSHLTTLETENGDLRQALDDIEGGRDAYRHAKAKTAQLEVRIGHSGVQLQGFLEQASKESGVDISETTEKQPTPAGKAYVERSVEVRIRKVSLEQLAKFLRRVETGPNLVVVTQLRIRTRDDKHEDLEVEMWVSTYEKAPAEKPGHKKETKG